MTYNVSENAQVYGNAIVYGDAQVSGNARVSGDARVYGNARVSGNAHVSGDADIQSNNDWFSFIYNGKTLTGYRSRNAIGYELNIDGESIQFIDLEYEYKSVVGHLCRKFTPRENKEKAEVENIIADLEKQLEEAKDKLKAINN